MEREKMSLLTPSAALRRRYRRDRLFLLAGRLAAVASFSTIGLIFLAILYTSLPAFTQSCIKLPIHFEETAFSNENLDLANYDMLVAQALARVIPGVTDPGEKEELLEMMSPGAAWRLQRMVNSNPKRIGTVQQLWLPASADIDMLRKGKFDRTTPERRRRLSRRQLKWYDQLNAEGRIKRYFNWVFFTAPNSTEAELAGIYGAVKGSLLTMFITLVLSFPLGAGTAIYLQEFAPRNRWTTTINVTISNLAAVPPILYGLLGLAVFINFFHLPRATPLVAGMVLSLMTFPSIIMASRNALAAVPRSVCDAALALGASRMQSITHHILPAAMPGILTGTLLGLAQAFGECAPLLMLGMVAFVGNIPAGITDPATVLPMQIYLWADNSGQGFPEKTAAAIVIMMLFLVIVNTIVLWLRRKFENSHPHTS